MRTGSLSLIALAVLLSGSLAAAQPPTPGPEAQATMRARQKEWAEKLAKSTWWRRSSPAPMSGKPAGGVCPSTDSCQLTFSPPNGEMVIVTSVWSATKLQCDGVASATPRGGSPIAPMWRCEERVLVEGPGAGWTGFLVTK